MSAVDGALSKMFRTAARTTTPISMDGREYQKGRSRARQLLFRLAMLTTGPALGVARQAEVVNGLAAWRLLLAGYEPNRTSHVVALLSPDTEFEELGAADPSGKQQPLRYSMNQQDCRSAKVAPAKLQTMRELGHTQRANLVATSTS